MNQRSGHLWSLLDWERGRSHLFVPVQGCKVSGRVSVGDGAPRPGEHHPCPPSSRASEPRVSEGQIVVVLSRQALPVGVLFSLTSHCYSIAVFYYKIRRRYNSIEISLNILRIIWARVSVWGYQTKIPQIPWSRAQLPDTN